jgi:hypothetical protein
MKEQRKRKVYLASAVKTGMQRGVEDESVLQVTVRGLAGEGSGSQQLEELAPGHGATEQCGGVDVEESSRRRSSSPTSAGKEMDVAGRFPVPDFPVTDPDFGMVSTDAAAWTPALLVAGLALDGPPQWADQRSCPRIAHDIHGIFCLRSPSSLAQAHRCLCCL